MNENSGDYVYEEHGIKYEMPLFEMLQLKRFLREEADPCDIYPIKNWHSNLENPSAVKVTFQFAKVANFI